MRQWAKYAAIAYSHRTECLDSDSDRTVSIYRGGGEWRGATGRSCHQQMCAGRRPPAATSWYALSRRPWRLATIHRYARITSTRSAQLEIVHVTHRLVRSAFTLRLTGRLHDAIRRGDRRRDRLNTYGRRAFSVAGPMAWNSLTDFIRDLTSSTDCFRRLLKTYLFARY